MKHILGIHILSLWLLVFVFVGQTRIQPTRTVTTEAIAPVEADPVLVGAGDIAYCKSSHEGATAALLDRIKGKVFTAGDNVYDVGSMANFQRCYGPSWGRHKERTFPTPGNHDYAWRQGRDYYAYFGAVAGKPDEGYYSFDLGTWHIVMLNSNIDVEPNSKQNYWLRRDLASHDAKCTLAVWHHPLFSSGLHRGDTRFIPLWNTLYDAGVDVIVNGHDHHYERFAPQTSAGKRDLAYGIRQFVVGTGGAPLYPTALLESNSEIVDNSSWGVIKFTLHSDSYTWEFIPTRANGFHDSGTAKCHGRPPTTG